MRYLIEPRDWTFAKGYGFLSFAKNVETNIGKKVSKNVSTSVVNILKNVLIVLKKLAADALKTASERKIKKPAEATGDLIIDKTSNKITTTLSESSPETVSSETEDITFDATHVATAEKPTKISRKRYISPKKRQEIIDELRLI